MSNVDHPRGSTNRFDVEIHLRQLITHVEEIDEKNGQQTFVQVDQFSI